MEVKKYIPSYKKAVLDMAKKTCTKEQIQILDMNLDAKERIGYCAFEKNRFIGFVVGFELNKDVICVSMWGSKDLGIGVEIARQAMALAKEKGYKELIFQRGKENNKIYKRSL